MLLATKFYCKRKATLNIKIKKLKTFVLLSVNWKFQYEHAIKKYICMYISPPLYPLEGPRSSSVAVCIPNPQILNSNHYSH